MDSKLINNVLAGSRGYIPLIPKYVIGDEAEPSSVTVP
jgi:hypothetical protein